MIAGQAGELPVKLMCRAAKASRSGYYAWKKRPESRRDSDNRRLVVLIKAIHIDTRKAYGSRRIHAELCGLGIDCDRHRVERLMRLEGIRAARAKSMRVPPDPAHDHPAAPNRLMRNFAVAVPDRVWLADITQLATKEGVLYVGLVMDLCSRMIVGWATRVHRDRWLTIAAVETAIGWRRPPPALIHRTDQGGQYACPDYVAVLNRHGIVPSMSPPGSPIDNAPMESFIKTFKAEHVYVSDLATRGETEAGIAEYIQSFYNCRRRHSALGYLSPAEYEKQLRKPT
jgi:putative transposase